jgi:hypothetical protein
MSESLLFTLAAFLGRRLFPSKNSASGRPTDSRPEIGPVPHGPVDLVRVVLTGQKTGTDLAVRTNHELVPMRYWNSLSGLRE